MIFIPGDPLGRKLHLEYLSPRDNSGDVAGKKRKDPDNPNRKRGGLVRREYRLVPHDYGLPLPCTPPIPTAPYMHMHMHSMAAHTHEEVPYRTEVVYI